MNLSPRSMLAAVPCLLLLGSSSCSNTVQLLSPPSGIEQQTGAAASPVFRWTTDYAFAPGEQVTYTLGVARDEGFAAPIFEKSGITQPSYNLVSGIDEGEGWLEGGETYWWQVDATVLDEDGEVRTEFGAEKPKKVMVARRPTISFDFQVHEGVQRITVADEEFTESSTFTMEVGESRRVTIYFGEGNSVSGPLKALAANEMTKLSNVVIDNVTMEELENMAATAAVFRGAYQAAGIKVAELNLGVRR